MESAHIVSFMDATSVGTKRDQTQPSSKSAPEKWLQGLSPWVMHGPLLKLTALDTQYHTLDFVDEFHLTLSLYITTPLFKAPGEST